MIVKLIDVERRFDSIVYRASFQLTPDSEPIVKEYSTTDPAQATPEAIKKLLTEEAARIEPLELAVTELRKQIDTPVDKWSVSVADPK